MGCSSAQKSQLTIQDLSALETQRKFNGGVDYLKYERLRADAAMYLYSHAKTDLKSGNSQKALEKLSEARTYNPWHDDIKDLYVISSKIFIETTKRMKTNCSVINDRLSFIYSHSPDFFNQVSGLAKKCNFKVSGQTYKINELPPEWKESEVKTFKSFENNLDAIIQKNSYIPKRELLIKQLKYISNLNFEIANIRPSQLNDNTSKVDVLVDLNVKNKSSSSEDFCKDVKSLLYSKGYEEEVMNSSKSYSSTGFIKCPYFNSWMGTKTMDFFTLPSWDRGISKFWPMPKKVYFDIYLKYKSGRFKKFRKLITTDFRPDLVEVGYNFKFETIGKNLTIKIKSQNWLKEGVNTLVFTTSKSNLVNLESVKLQVNYKETFRYYLN